MILFGLPAGQKLSWTDKYNYLGLWKSKLWLKISKTHPAFPISVYLFGEEFALKPDFFSSEKKTSSLHFWILVKTLTCNCANHWYLQTHGGILHKIENYGLEVFFFNKFERVFLYILSSRSTRWPILKFKTTSFCISFSFFEFLIKFCLKIMYHLSY